jgi:hypothetical protein
MRAWPRDGLESAHRSVNEAFLGQQLDARAMTMRASESAVASEQHCRERFGERDFLSAVLRK